jgi:carboxyl-terminal processing protease
MALLVKMTVVRCATVVAAMLLIGCSCKAFVLPPAATTTPLSKKTSTHQYSNVLHNSSDDGDRLLNNPAKLSSRLDSLAGLFNKTRTRVRLPIGILSSQLQQTLNTFVTATVLFTTILTSPVNVHVNTNEPAITIEKSQAYALNENQLFISDVWFKVTTQYFDQSFNGLGESGWRAKEKEAFQAVEDTGPEDDEIVVDAIKTMLSALGDPYTRFLPKEKYEVLTAYATGGSGKAGIGVQLLEDPRTKNVVVMATTSGGPADLAGVQAGDVILKIDGEDMTGASAEIVAAKCRGEQGQKVDVVFLRKDENGNAAGKESLKSLTRAQVKVNPIQTQLFTSVSGKRVGLLRVPSFSTETVKEMVDGLRSISDNGKLDAIAIDIRGNVGGYMPAGVSAANLFLPARAHIIAEVDKSGAIKGYDADGIGAETSTPLYLLVDGRTASAAEIFAAALQDNQRGIVVGSKTFGKGRIQNVQPLENGSGLAITRARYITPKGRDLHGVGIIPNKEPSQCESADSARTCLADIV